MTTIIWPSNTKNIIDRIRGVIGRDITIHYLSSGVPCPDCTLDSLTGRPFDPFCDTCDGTGTVASGIDVTVSGHIRWNRTDPEYRSPAGKIYTGDCKVTIANDEDILAIIKAAEYFLVDDERLYLESYDPKGVQAVNRIALNLRQDPREGR